MTTVQGIASVTLPARLVDALSVPDGGFTIDPGTGQEIRTGYAVSIFPQYERKIAGDVTPEDLALYLADNADALGQPGAVFGAWRCPQDGIAYLDVSIVVKEKERALRMASEHNQLAIFDFATGSSVN